MNKRDAYDLFLLLYAIYKVIATFALGCTLSGLAIMGITHVLYHKFHWGEALPFWPSSVMIGTAYLLLILLIIGNADRKDKK